jgi:hypothetical protein
LARLTAHENTLHGFTTLSLYTLISVSPTCEMNAAVEQPLQLNARAAQLGRKM